MPTYAPAALGIAVALSAIGAVTICVLIMLYGFTPAGEEPPGETSRRLLATRIGHALAAVCFAGTAILIAIVLVRPAMWTTPAPAVTSAPAAAVPETLADQRVPELGAKVDGQETRLSEAEARMQRLERELRERVTAPPPAPVAAPVPAAAPAPAAASAPVHRRVTPKTGGPTSSVAPHHSAAAPRVAATPPSEKRAAAALPSGSSPAASPSTETSVPPSPSSPVVAPATPPSSTPAPVPPPPVAAAPASAASASTSTRVTGPPHFDLKAKLREDWRAIRRGVDSAPGDLRRTVDETKRGLGID